MLKVFEAIMQSRCKWINIFIVDNVLHAQGLTSHRLYIQPIDALHG